MTDIFADFVTDEMLDRIFAVMALCPQHTFQVLTKRPERMRKYLSADGLLDRLVNAAFRIDQPDGASWAADIHSGHDHGLPLPNVWLGVTAENQKAADERIQLLLATPAAIRWVSVEPMLSAVDLSRIPFLDGDPRHKRDALTGQALTRLDWVVAGGESGKAARPSHPDWFRSLRDQCAAASVPFLFDQCGEWIDAEEWLDMLTQSGELSLFEDDLQTPWSPKRPMNYATAAHFATAMKKPFKHQSAGTTMIRTGKKAAGRLLDGVLHHAFPEAR
jgi:protein gp37